MSEFDRCSPALACALRAESFDASTLLEECRAEFQRLSPAWAFAAASGNLMDGRLPTAGVFLALVNVLHRRGETFDTIRAVALDTAREMVAPGGLLQRTAKRAVGHLATTRLASLLFERAIEKAPSHERGFRLRVVNAREQGFHLGFDIVECGICKLFHEAGASEYTRILCEVDFMTSQIAGLELHRTGTLANGAPACDFRFRRKQR